MKTAFVVTALLACAGAHAQWSIDPALNRAIADRSGDQVQPKAVPDGAGGAYISWFDNFAGGYDVRIQHVDRFGYDLIAANGVELCNRSVSSTIDYDMVAISGGRAAIVYTEDTLTPGGTQQVTFQVVNPDGTTAFAAPGVRVTSDALFKGNPHVVELSTGEFVVGWSSGSPQSWTFQKLSAAGVPQFPGQGITVSEASRYLALSDMVPTLDGGFIALWIRGTTANAITSAKALYTQKYSNTGGPQWFGGAPVIIFNTTSVQNGYFPTMLADGEGGAVYSWYEIGGSRNSYVQHISTIGGTYFPAPVASTGATPGRIRVSGSASYDASSREYYIVSQDTAGTTQSDNRVLAQRINAAGQRLWGNDGTVVIAANANQPSFVQCRVAPEGGCTVFGIDSRSATTHVVFAAGVSPGGQLSWQNLASPVVAAKSRLAFAPVLADEVVLAFGHGASGGSTDIWAQNLRIDGRYGVAPVVRSTSPLQVTECDGASVTLFADVAGSGPMDIVWSRNGNQVGTGSDLLLASVDSADAGTYVLTATNALGSAEASFVVGVCFADFDCSGGVDSDDTIAFFAEWDANGADADVDGSGGVDSDDVIVFFAQWDAGC
jgi:hypothetical protein